MSNNREIITLQLGDYANHVATHYWNLEWENSKLNTHDIDSKESDDNDNCTNINTTNPYKSAKYKLLKPRSKSHRSSNHSGAPSKRDESHKNINPNICFHSNRQQQYTPRTIIFATQGSEGNITSNVYDSSSNHNNSNNNITTWDNKVNIVKQQQHKTENKSDCKFWSDYLLPPLHDKSLFLLDGIHHFSTPFYSYSTGYDLLNGGTASSNDLLESMDDRIRYFAESCDWFQGFQIFQTAHDSFSAILPPLINAIHDDYNNKCVLLYNLSPSQSTAMQNYDKTFTNKQSIQMMDKRFKLNSIISTAQIWDEVSNIIPISVDFWHKNDKNKFYNTSIIASCLHHYTNCVRLNQSNIRLMDIINCYIKRNSMKMSMLSSCSSHLDLNMNYQAIDCIEKLLMFDPKQKQPIFPRLTCLGPVSNKYLTNNYVLNSKIFGEYSCLNGTNLYKTSEKVIGEWKRNKMILAQKQGSSKTDIELFCDQWRYDSEEENYHLRLMTKLASKTQSPLKWHLIKKSWKLPSVHPFYYDKNNDSQQKQDDNDNDHDHEEEDENRNKYSMWSSGWSSSIIGETYLNESAQNVNDVIKYGLSTKIFGDVELDLNQYREELSALADTYSGETDIDK